MATTDHEIHALADLSARTAYTRAFLLFSVVAALSAGCRIEGHTPSRSIDPAVLDEAAFTAVHTVVYHVPDLDAAREWYQRALEIDPYRVEPAYVAFRLGANELGLDPDTTARAPGVGGTIAYWTVDDIESQVRRFLDLGATAHTPVRTAAAGLRVAVLVDPFGNAIGLMQDTGSASGGAP